MSAPFRDRVATFARDRCGLAPGAAVVVGVSGGIDSTVLLWTLAALGYTCTAAHVHHGLRPDADADAEAARALAENVGVTFRLERVDVGPGNVLAAAREARYEALARVAREVGPGAVAVGHTATDQAETVLMRLARGSGLHGLGGMAPARDLAPGVGLVRPLLGVTRAELWTEAQARRWTWAEDPSNTRLDRARTLLRHSVLPVLDDVGGGRAVAHLAAFADDARAASLAGGSAGLQLAGTPDALGGRLDVATLRRLTPDAAAAVVAEAIRAWVAPERVSRSIVRDVLALVDARPGRRASVGPAMAWRDRDAVRLVRAHEHAVEPVILGSGVTETPWGTLVRTPLAEVPTAFSPEPREAIVDADSVGEGLVVRPWAAGERIEALGLPRPALVSDLLGAARVEPSERARQVVVVAGEQVMWVAGHRLAARAAVTGRTTRAERWRWTPEADRPPAPVVPPDPGR